MQTVLPQHLERLRDVFGATIGDGDCVLDEDHEVGYVRLNLGPSLAGPDSPHWDGWFSVTRTRHESPLRGKATEGERVQLISRAAR